MGCAYKLLFPFLPAACAAVYQGCIPSMALYEYFKKKANFTLPDKKGQLSKVVPSSYIAAAHKEVSQLLKRHFGL